MLRSATLLRLRGGYGMDEKERRPMASHASLELFPVIEGLAGFKGEVELSTEKQSLPLVVENANGPLLVKCRWPGGYSWDGAAGVDSNHAVDVVGEVAAASGAASGKGNGEAEKKPVLAGQWFLMEGSHGSFTNVSLVYRFSVDRENLENRLDMLIVGGGKWEINECSLWTWWGGVVACVESAYLCLTSTIISGAGGGDMRCEFAVSAFMRARVGFSRCLIQHASSVGARFCDKSEGVLSGCTLRLCQVALSIDDQCKVHVDTSSWCSNSLANLYASEEASEAELVLKGCHLHPPTHPAEESSTPNTWQLQHSQQHWLTTDRPGTFKAVNTHLAASSSDAGVAEGGGAECSGADAGMSEFGLRCVATMLIYRVWLSKSVGLVQRLGRDLRTLDIPRKLQELL
jgi:hypothetical protein